MQLPLLFHLSKLRHKGQEPHIREDLQHLVSGGHIPSHKYFTRYLLFALILLLYNLQIALLFRLNLRELLNSSVVLFVSMVVLGSIYLASIREWRRHLAAVLGFWLFMLTIAPWWAVQGNTVWNPYMQIGRAHV